MGEGKDEEGYDSLIVPSYEEATSSRRASSESRRGPEEISDDAERQGLLSDQARINIPSNRGYQPPTVESARSSLEFLSPAHATERASADDLRQEIEQLEIDEADLSAQLHRSLLASRFSKRITSLTNSFSSLNLPFRRFVPSFSLPQIRPRFSSTLDSDRLILLGRLFGALLSIAIVYVLVATDVFSLGSARPFGQVYDPESVRMYVQSKMNKEGNIQEYLEYLTRDVHVAGTKGDLFYADWVKELFEASSLEDVELERFDVYLNYPQEHGRRVAIVDPPEMAWEAVLEEKAAGGNRQQTYSPVFHGHSKTGDVTGRLVYANHGSRHDFEWLQGQKISLDGAIALVRSGGSPSDAASKAKAAELAGAAGCIIYSELSSQDTPWLQDGSMPPDGVERGTVSQMAWVVGDVLSPGWASTPGEERRLGPEESSGLVNIPSMPLSWHDGKHLLEALQDQGQETPSGWQGSPLASGYWTGGQTSPLINLKNLQDEVNREPIYNVLGRISGWERPEKKVIVGNHRDAWCVGAADPGSGTAIMLEVVRVFGQLRKLGWKPLRTIEFASWDGEEYNLIGSTEHVESRQDELRRDGVAYINVDVGVSGTDFRAAASPLYEQALLRVLGRTVDPTQNQTLRHLWDAHDVGLEGLGAESDYVAFQDIAGVSSIDFGFRGQGVPHHSCHDNYAWMTQFGDPNFEYHTVMGQVWALLLLELADSPFLPFDMEVYAKYLKTYVADLDGYVQSKQKASHRVKPLDLNSLYRHAADFETEARTFHDWDRAWKKLVYSSGGVENNVMSIQRMSHNDRMANFETYLLDLEGSSGLQDRTQLKHILFTPQKWPTGDKTFFPSIREAVDVGDWDAAQSEVDAVANILGKAIHKLNHN